MTTFTDGTPPSVTPEPEDGSGSRGAREDAHRNETDAADTDSWWLRDEIQRRVSEGGSGGSGGRHARRGNPASPTGSYVPRHSVATPGPGSPPPGPVGGGVSPQASELLRRERAAADRAAWSGPPGPAGEGPGVPGTGGAATGAEGPGPPAASPLPPPGDAADTATDPGVPEESPPNVAATAFAADAPAATARRRVAGPGVAAAAAMRGAALGRTKAARGAVMPPTDVLPAVPDTTAPEPAAETDPPTPETAPVEPAPAPATGATAAVEPADVETSPVPPLAPRFAATTPQDGVSPTERIDAVVPPPAPAWAAAQQAEAPAGEHAGEAEAGTSDPAPDAQAPTVRNPQVGPLPGVIVVPEQRSAGEAFRAQDAPPDAPVASDDAESRRVRVVLAERKSVAHPVRTVVDVQEGTGVGALLRTNLIGSQLAVALRFAVGAGLTLGLLPLLFAMVPEIGRIHLLGVPLPWLVLGLLVYPFLFGLGMWHARTAERVEQNFADHVQD